MRKQREVSAPLYQYWTELTPGSCAEISDRSRVGSWSLRRWLLKWHVLLACWLAEVSTAHYQSRIGCRVLQTIPWALVWIWASVSWWSVGSEQWAVAWVDGLHVTTGGAACLGSLEQCGALFGTWTQARRKPCSCLFLHTATYCWHFDCLPLLVWPSFSLRPNNKISGGIVATV